MISDTYEERARAERFEREAVEQEQYQSDCERASVVPRRPTESGADAAEAARRRERVCQLLAAAEPHLFPAAKACGLEWAAAEWTVSEMREVLRKEIA